MMVIVTALYSGVVVLIVVSIVVIVIIIVVDGVLLSFNVVCINTVVPLFVIDDDCSGSDSSI